MRKTMMWGVLVLLSMLAGPQVSAAQQALPLSGAYAFTHDPSIAKDGKTYYVFATGKSPDGGQFPVRCSEDLAVWRLCGHVFDALPQWVVDRSPGTKELWAPDVSYTHGVYRLYYAYSLFGRNLSGIGLATNVTLDPASAQYKWVDHGLVLESVKADNFNAIDPNYVEDAEGHAWLSFGSFWSGIKMRQLDPVTGMLDTQNKTVYAIASRHAPEHVPVQTFDPEHPVLPPDWQAVEAPFIFRHDDYFYLFVSWDLCCRGVKSTYKTVVGRSHSVTGPYVDRDGVVMEQGGGSLLLDRNATWAGPGGESALHRKDGPDLLVFHAYDAQTGRPALQISTIAWEKGWPVVALGSQAMASVSGAH